MVSSSLNILQCVKIAPHCSCVRCVCQTSDLAGGCTTMPVSAAFCSRTTPTVWMSTRYLPQVHTFCQWWFCFNSAHSLSWVAICKLIAITKPLRCEQILSRKRCYVILAFNWIVGAALAATKFSIYTRWFPNGCMFAMIANNVFEATLMQLSFILSGVVPSIALIVTTFMMLVVVTRAHKQIFAQVQSIGSNSPFAAPMCSIVNLRMLLSTRFFGGFTIPWGPWRNSTWLSSGRPWAIV